MDTVGFFNTILPAAGLRCIALPYKSGRGFQHIFGDTNQWLANAVQHIDRTRQVNTYFACASFKDNSSREQANVAYVRSFWADLDVGPPEPGKPPKYETARAAAMAVLMFSEKLGLPRPFLVSSGRGVHVYWPTNGDMTPAVWRPTAELLKAALTAEGVLQDRSRTADHASVLRPPGTFHRKAEPKLVKIVVVGEVGTLAEIQAALLPYGKLVEPDDMLPAGGPAGDLTVDNSDLTKGVEYRKADAHQMAERCGIIRMIRDTRGVCDEPTWYAAIGTLALTEQGSDIAHEWSKGDPRYDPKEVDRKIKQHLAKTGSKASTCAKLGEHHPAICAACPHRGVNSPWSLGLKTSEVVVVEERVQAADGTWSTRKVTRAGPDGFQLRGDMGQRVMFASVPTGEKDADGNMTFEWQAFCETAVTPITRLWIDGVAYIECEMELKNNQKRMFLLEGGIIGKGKDTLAAELGRQEVVCKPGKGIYMDSYLKGWMQRLKEEADQVVAYPRFGWNGEAFVLGDDILLPDGSAQRAVLVGMAKSKAEAVQCKGSLDLWIEAVDRAYNAPGQEGYQFLVVNAFAAPLIGMTDLVSGVTVYAHSDGSGTGKTTAQKAGLSAWGDWEELMLADNKVTHNALWGLMGAYNSLPVVYDELTNTPNHVASELVFSVSSGRSKQRMAADGSLRQNNSNWRTILMASGNTLLSEKLALHRSNAEAEISRLFEFTLQPQPRLTPNEANVIFPQMRANCGHAGRAFAHYVVTHRAEVIASLLHVQHSINDRLNIRQVERFWSALIAANVVALTICRKLGLLHFDAAALNKWMVERLNENRNQRNEAVSDPLELIGSMLADLWQGVLVTNGEGDIRKGINATVIEKPRGQLVGRAIIPTQRNEAPVLMLNVQAVRDWANRKGVSAKEMFAAAVRSGWADPADVRYSLGKGTVEYSQTSSYLRCWKLNPEKIGAAAGQMVAQKLGVVDGGAAAAGA